MPFIGSSYPVYNIHVGGKDATGGTPVTVMIVTDGPVNCKMNVLRPWYHIYLPSNHLFLKKKRYYWSQTKKHA